MNFNKQKGVALILVLLSLTLLASAGSYLLDDDHMAIRRVENQHASLQAQYVAQSGLQWAMLVLQKDGELSKTDHLNEPWNTLTQPIDIENGSLTIEVIDAQSKFNLNNLRSDTDGAWMSGLKRLIESLDLTPELAARIKDWIDVDSSPTGFDGAEDDEYLLDDPAMRTANGFMGDISELLLIKGVDTAVFEKIAPFLTAIPGSDLKINVNTCHEALFRIFGRTTLPEGVGVALAAGRGEDGYSSVEDFVTATPLASHGDVAGNLADVSTAYFVVNVTGSYGRVNITNRYLLKRTLEDQVYIDILRVTSVS